MSLSPRSIATLGIGFGALAAASLGLVAVPDPVTQGKSGASRYELSYSSLFSNETQQPEKVMKVVFEHPHEAEDEEAVVVFVLTELIKNGVI